MVNEKQTQNHTFCLVLSPTFCIIIRSILRTLNFIELLCLNIFLNPFFALSNNMNHLVINKNDCERIH